VVQAGWVRTMRRSRKPGQITGTSMRRSKLSAFYRVGISNWRTAKQVTSWRLRFIREHGCVRYGVAPRRYGSGTGQVSEIPYRPCFSWLRR
jgi:hypothetical protein